MKISKQARREAKQLFRSCVTNGGVLDEGRVRLAVKRVLEVKPRGYMPILSHFERLLRLEIERRTARPPPQRGPGLTRVSREPYRMNPVSSDTDRGTSKHN